MKNNLFVLRFKALFADKITCMILLITVFIFLIIINSLSFHADDRSSIPVGILDLDQSSSTKELVKNLQKVSSLYVYEGTEKELRELLQKNEIKAYFILNSGYEDMIRAGKTNGLIAIKYLEGDESAKILSDIVTGEMLYKICQYKGFRRYASLEQQDGGKDKTGRENTFRRLTAEEYMDYTDLFLQMQEFDFAFDIKMIQISDPDRDEDIPNSILYLEAVWGITAMLLSFLAMVMTAGMVFEKELGIRKRAKIALIKPFALDFSHFGAVFSILSLLAVLICLSLSRQIPNFIPAQAGRIFLLIELFAVVMVLWFGLLAKLAGTTGKYQTIGIVSVLIFGFFGFVPLIAGFLAKDILNISKFIPNCWFIKEFTDIILNTNLKNISNNSYPDFMIAVCGLFVLHGLINKRQYS